MQSHRLLALLPASPKGAFVAGFALSAILGLTVILVIGPVTGLSGGFGGEAHDGYWEIATSLGRGEGFVFEPGGPPELHRPPLVPLLFAPLTLLPAGLQRPGVVLVQSLLFGATCLVTFNLARRVGGKRLAKTALVLLLLYPWTYWHVKNPMSVLAHMLGVVLIVDWGVAELMGRKEAPGGFGRFAVRTVAAGVAMGLFCLVHGATFPAVVLLLLLLLVVGMIRGSRQLMFAAGFSGLVAAAIVAPWTCRNWKVTNHFVPVVHSAGFAYFLGNSHWGLGVDVKGTARATEFQQGFAAAGLADASRLVRFSGVTDVATADALGARMVQDMKAHPVRLAGKMVLNALELYFPVLYDLAGPRHVWGGLAVALETVAVSAAHAALWTLALIGLCKASRPKARLVSALVFLAALIFSLANLLTVAGTIGHAQYVAPLMPLWAILAAGGLWALLPAASAGVKRLNECPTF